MNEAIHLLRGGGVGVIPTDTIYCMVARATMKVAVKRLYEIKGRHRKPGPIIAANIQQLIDLGVEPSLLAEREPYWAVGQGPTCVETPMPRRLAYLHQHTGRQALRVVTDRIVCQTLDETGALLVTSANLPKQEPAVDLDSAWKYFRDTVDFYVDGGSLAGRVASQIIRLDRRGPLVVRAGQPFHHAADSR